MTRIIVWLRLAASGNVSGCRAHSSIQYPSGSRQNAKPFMRPSSGRFCMVTPAFSSAALVAYTSSTLNAMWPNPRTTPSRYRGESEGRSDPSLPLHMGGPFSLS